MDLFFEGGVVVGMGDGTRRSPIRRVVYQAINCHYYHHCRSRLYLSFRSYLLFVLCGKIFHLLLYSEEVQSCGCRVMFQI